MLIPSITVTTKEAMVEIDDYRIEINGLAVTISKKGYRGQYGLSFQKHGMHLILEDETGSAQELIDLMDDDYLKREAS